MAWPWVLFCQTHFYPPPHTTQWSCWACLLKLCVCADAVCPVSEWGLALGRGPLPNPLVGSELRNQLFPQDRSGRLPGRATVGGKRVGALWVGVNHKSFFSKSIIFWIKFKSITYRRIDLRIDMGACLNKKPWSTQAFCFKIFKQPFNIEKGISEFTGHDLRDPCPIQSEFLLLW